MEMILRCVEGTSNKQYRIVLESLQDGYAVHCYNRRVGNPWTDQGAKVKGVELPKAQLEALKVADSKMKKGYYVESGGF